MRKVSYLKAQLCPRTFSICLLPSMLMKSRFQGKYFATGSINVLCRSKMLSRFADFTVRITFAIFCIRARHIMRCFCVGGMDSEVPFTTIAIRVAP